MTPIPENAAVVLDVALAERPDAEALVTRRDRLTYSQLDERAARATAVLASLGVSRGDRVAVSLANGTDVVVIFHAVMRRGAIFVGINRPLAAPEKRFILADSEASVFVGDEEMTTQIEPLRGDLPALRHVIVANPGDETSAWSALMRSADPLDPVAIGAHEPAGLAYTSGTTGFPKGVIHSHHNLLVPGAAVNAARRYGPDLRKADCLALTILNMQVLSTLLVAQAQGTAVVMDRVDAAGVADWLRAERPTVFNAVPTMLHGLTHATDVTAADLASLRELWTGGADCPPAIRDGFEKKFGRRIYGTYGLTEAPTIVTQDPLDAMRRPGASGVPLPHLRVEIVGRDDEPCAPGEVGEVCVSAVDEGDWAGVYTPMLGYWRNAEATAKTIRNGRLHTGDLGELDQDGFLTIRDRTTAVILRGAANVYPAEVERVLAAYPGVAGSSVVGIPDERLGERVGALVEVQPGQVIDADSLLAHCRKELARYKVPDVIVFGEVPRNAMGKAIRPTVESTVRDHVISSSPSPDR
ncbi:MAG: class I adenylate-forming enzyme family protein [Acidimicrobiia bacterium]